MDNRRLPDIQFDPELVARYDKPGPRYTSYPTAPHFDVDFTPNDLAAQARLGNDEPIPRPMSIYVHVPFCWSPCFYCGCNRVITRDVSKAEAYLLRLVREVEMTAPMFDRDREVRQLHFGGGTPNFLRPDQIAEFVGVLGRHFNLSRAADRYFSIELDPRLIQRDGAAFFDEQTPATKAPSSLAIWTASWPTPPEAPSTSTRRWAGGTSRIRPRSTTAI